MDSGQPQGVNRMPDLPKVRKKILSENTTPPVSDDGSGFHPLAVQMGIKFLRRNCQIALIHQLS